MAIFSKTQFPENFLAYKEQNEKFQKVIWSHKGLFADLEGMALTQ